MTKRRSVTLALLAVVVNCGLQFVVVTARAAEPKWQASIPAIASESTEWTRLINELSNRGLFAGVVAAASRMIMFFSDLPAKEAAYKAIIASVDRGYPSPVLSLFQPGDLFPAGDYEFVNSYNLYKGLLNKERGLDKWAKQYLDGVDKTGFRKYLFLQAIESYAKKDYKDATEKLKEILSKEQRAEAGPFVRKVVRTLARAYFEQENYSRAYDIYSTFLLKLQPVDPRDWLEAAWCLYYLKRNGEALGMLYNLESRAASDFVNLEKYTIRALIYRNQCAVNNAELLAQSFQKDFGFIITGIKRGKPLVFYQRIANLDVPENSDYQQLAQNLEWLGAEQKLLRLLPSKMQGLAAYLYRSEIRMLSRRAKLYATDAFDRAAKKLVMVDENLRFLKFAVQREKFNPDMVFEAPSATEDMSAVLDTGSENVRIHWLQNGDYWRDERLNYKGILPNRCFE